MGACVLAWIVGSETLYDAWNPNILVLPFAWFVVLAWATSCGRLRQLPMAVALASFCVQTHLGFAAVVVTMLIAPMVMGMRWPLSQHGSVRRSLAVATGVGVVLWAQPVWEQLTSAGRGNMSRIVDAGSSVGDPAGPSFAVRVFADVLSPVTWVRPRFEKVWSLFSADSMPSEGASILILVVAVGAGLAIAVAAGYRPSVGCGRSSPSE